MQCIEMGFRIGNGLSVHYIPDRQSEEQALS